MKRIVEQIIRFIAPDFEKWEKVCVTQEETNYYLIIQRRNKYSGLYQFRTLFIGKIIEPITIKELDNLIK